MELHHLKLFFVRALDGDLRGLTWEYLGGLFEGILGADLLGILRADLHVT
ncbi:MAG: hypothetical protein BWX81_00752 [Spirochaetes bacterium ADurb.Bin110]|jgi:hypothetical protein|nr:MAG: hypothetical protein BWX81_00752 [Spirochaetes bacterium ADurb.Bin110]